GDFHDAVELLEQASGKEPDNPRLRLQLGRALLQAGETGRAVNELLAARERAPGLADIRLHLAVAFLRDGRVDEARSELQTIGPRLA
ncbi:MAG: tetratricopeptide repeat protein, partial [Akkermansiaceae bacterium]|nr:tetratricopeptide repeat protein [Akkermansiaceae bacterium]